MSFTKSDALVCVQKATKAVDFENTSELSKKEFEEIIANAIYQAINSLDFKRFIKEQCK